MRSAKSDGISSARTPFLRPSSSITPGHLADFVPIQREEFLKALDILKDTTLDYTNHKRRILYLMRNYKYTDDEPLVLSK